MSRPARQRRRRLWQTPLVAAAILAGGCTTAAPDETVDPALFVAFLAEIPEGGAVFDVRRHMYVVDSPDDGLIALLDRDPFRGCRIAHIPKVEHRIDNPLIHFEATRFVDPCHGSEYDGNGRYLAGPSPRSMDRIPIEVVGDAIVLDGDDGGIVQVPRPTEPLP
jgi:nitrite reductase/ring-hydroxylating ferredoxin subunit